MKIKHSPLGLTIFVLAILICGCKKEKDPLSELPEETQFGKGTFGCLINGRAFVAKNSVFAGPTILSYYQYIYNSPSGYVFVARGTRDFQDCEFKTIEILGDSVIVEEGKTYSFGDCKKGEFCAEYRFNLNMRCTFPSYKHKTIKPNSGQLTIKKFDNTNKIVAGTFWFDTLDSNGAKLEIREGRFDLKFTR